jgi:hypothetical protein
VVETERKLACGTLAGDARSFRALYDLAFRIAWAFSLRSTGEPRLAEAATAAALRRVFATLAPLAEGREGLGTRVLRCVDEALRELQRPAPPDPGAATVAK